MSSKNEFAFKLEQTESIIQWAVTEVPSGRLMELPPHGKHPNSDKGFKTYFGEWPALRQLFHLTFYEETYAIPTMKHWLGDPHPSVDLIFPDPELDERAWRDAVGRGVTATPLLDRLHELRAIQLSLLRDIPEESWHIEKVSTGLGTVSAEFVLAKTIQHSLEHANELMKNALYWERALAWLDRQVAG